MAEAGNINWYPGHMKKATRMMEENLRLVDAVAEIRDARIPESSRNPDIDRIAAGMPRLIILNRADQADPAVTADWSRALTGGGAAALEMDCKSGKGVGAFPTAARNLLSELIERSRAKGKVGRPLRFMVLGIPNVGKSSFINRLAGRKAAQTSDRPGVTRGKQWISLPNNIQLLDTPGILWPKFEDEETGLMLAVTNAIKSEILDTTAVGADFILKLSSLYPEKLKERYKIEAEDAGSGYELLEKAAAKRGFLVSKGEYDIDRMALTLLKEFQDGKLGRLSLERP